MRRGLAHKITMDDAENPSDGTTNGLQDIEWRISDSPVDYPDAIEFMEQRAADRAERVKENESLKTAVMEAVNAKTNALDTRLGGIEGLLTQLIAVQAANQAGSQK